MNPKQKNMSETVNHLCHTCQADGVARAAEFFFKEINVCRDHSRDIRKEEIIQHLRKPDHTILQKYKTYMEDYGGLALYDVIEEYKQRYSKEIVQSIYDSHKWENG